MALYAVLRALFPDGGARIGVQAFTCPVVFEAIRHSGNKPVFFDVDNDATVSLADLKARQNEIDAVIVTHTFGIPADCRAIRHIIGDKPLIEDCAHAVFSSYDGMPTGRLGDAAFYSFGLAKPISLGGGGLLRVRDPKLAKKTERIAASMQQLTWLAQRVRIIKAALCSVLHSRPFYDAITRRYLKRLNKRLDITGDTAFDLRSGGAETARILSNHWQQFEAAARKRRRNADRLATLLGGRFGCRWNKFSAEADPDAYVFFLRSSDSEEVIGRIRSMGFEASRHFNDALNHARDFGYATGDCPESEKLVRDLFTVPVHERLESADVDRLGSCLISIANETHSTPATGRV